MKRSLESINFEAQNSFESFLEDEKIVFQKSVNRLYIINGYLKIRFYKIGESYLYEGDCCLVWADLWISKAEVIKSKIRIKLGLAYSLPARLMEVRRIEPVIAYKFLEAHHLLSGVSAKYFFGLFLKKNYDRLLPLNLNMEVVDRLFGVMSVSNARILRQEGNLKSYEISRVAFLKNFRIHGGVSKFVQAFVRDKESVHLMTYIDADWGDSGGFESLGFVKAGEPSAIYYKLKEMERLKLKDMEGAEVVSRGSYKWVKNGF